MQIYRLAEWAIIKSRADLQVGWLSHYQVKCRSTGWLFWAIAKSNADIQVSWVCHCQVKSRSTGWLSVRLTSHMQIYRLAEWVIVKSHGDLHVGWVSLGKVKCGSTGLLSVPLSSQMEIYRFVGCAIVESRGNLLVGRVYHCQVRFTSTGWLSVLLSRQFHIYRLAECAIVKSHRYLRVNVIWNNESFDTNVESEIPVYGSRKNRSHALWKRRLNSSSKWIDLGQPPQSAQSDLGRTFSVMANFLCVQGPFYLMIYLIVYKCVLIDLYVTHQAKRDFMGIAKSIDPGQPAQSAQSDHGRNFSLLADFFFFFFCVLSLLEVIILPN